MIKLHVFIYFFLFVRVYSYGIFHNVGEIVLVHFVQNIEEIHTLSWVECVAIMPVNESRGIYH